MKSKINFWLVVVFALGIVLGVVLTSYIYLNYLSAIPQPQKVIVHERTAPQNQTSYSGSFSVERTVPIVAVDSEDGTGVVGKLKVRLIPGNSNVLIDTNPFLETDLQYSANVAVTVAKLRSNYTKERDFILSYEIPSQVVGGGSAGAATTIAVMAALQNKKIRPGVAVTGTINPDGSIGRIGGVLEKAKAVADANYTLFLVPKGQTKIRYYEKVVEKEPFGFGFMLYNTRYVPRTLDIKKQAEEWGLEIKEVSTIEDVARYMLE